MESLRGFVSQADLILYNRASCWKFSQIFHHLVSRCTFKVGEKWFFPSVHDAVVGCLRHQKVGPSCRPWNLKHLGARTRRVHLNIDVSWCFRQCYSSHKQTRAVTCLIHGTCRFPVSEYRANMRWILGHAEESPVWQAKRKLYATRSVFGPVCKYRMPGWSLSGGEKFLGQPPKLTF